MGWLTPKPGPHQRPVDFNGYGLPVGFQLGAAADIEEPHHATMMKIFIHYVPYSGDLSGIWNRAGSVRAVSHQRLSQLLFVIGETGLMRLPSRDDAKCRIRPGMATRSLQTLPWRGVRAVLADNHLMARLVLAEPRCEPGFFLGSPVG